MGDPSIVLPESTSLIGDGPGDPVCGGRSEDDEAIEGLRTPLALNGETSPAPASATEPRPDNPDRRRVDAGTFNPAVADGILQGMRPPSRYDDEILQLARALVADPESPPMSGDPVTQAAASQVGSALDDYDRQLFARVRQKPLDSPSRAGVEEAVAYRIQSARAQLRAGLAAISSAGERER